ncbi:poly(U)-specific 3'-to-5' RNA exonuclease [Cytospora paraplurivora]|uniref:U6 snRNA phosphodiesterase n=1 Tax=Cytospora paraplurivora TaxID=2898453 RepID=A0AAN9YBD8_9PEZI
MTVPNPCSPATTTKVNTPLPPLPPQFHDLYASTVRTATADLPSLHNGRKRVIPHKEGNWPSHIYTEWHPAAPQHALLRGLLTSLAAALAPVLEEGSHELAGFLESGLGAPLPLHVSLSRPFVLRTEEKDEFLQDLVRRVEGSRIGRFEMVCDELDWHRSPDSQRSFLVLRVRSSSSLAGGGGGGGGGGKNPELSALLARCNDLVASYGQPTLYAATPRLSPRLDGGPGENREGDVGGGGDAFHISIAWSFASPSDEIRRRTAEVFARPEFRDAIARDITIPVEGVKAKIGNVVTNIALRKGRKGKGLFGVG